MTRRDPPPPAGLSPYAGSGFAIAVVLRGGSTGDPCAVARGFGEGGGTRFRDGRLEDRDAIENRWERRSVSRTMLPGQDTLIACWAALASNSPGARVVPSPTSVAAI